MIQSVTEQPPSEEKLRLLLKNHPPEVFADKVEGLITKWKLPYIVVRNSETGVGTLQDTLSQGELYLKRFVTVNDKMLLMKEQAKKMAKSEYEVLITGETGTGKELIAMSMIDGREGPIKALNCAGFPSELIESELFGHVKGSFTGAYAEKQGLISAAKDGICFLDEVGELEMTVQAKLLRALQFKKIRKVGSNVEEDTTCKFVCATNRNLRAMVTNGQFRRDLYARISTLEIDISPLRNRPEDIEPIILSLPKGKEFLEKYPVSQIKLMSLDLNVRSLQQYIIRYSVLGTI